MGEVCLKKEDGSIIPVDPIYLPLLREEAKIPCPDVEEPERAQYLQAWRYQFNRLRMGYNHDVHHRGCEHDNPNPKPVYENTGISELWFDELRRLYIDSFFATPMQEPVDD